LSVITLNEIHAEPFGEAADGSLREVLAHVHAAAEQGIGRQRAEDQVRIGENLEMNRG
jgi:hypothetical protein